MKRASTRFWLFASFALILGVPGPAQESVPRAKRASAPTRANESTLGGLRPGKDGKIRAVAVNKAFGSPRGEDGTTVWFDTASCEKINLDLDPRSMIQTIRLSTNVYNGQKTCTAVPVSAGWKTGRGLSLRASCAQAIELYGEPTSRSPSTKNGQPLELLYYAFDWAGPDVPQVMEVVCTVEKEGKPGRVVEITLAAGSL